jgi:UDP-glucose 4-epimerase
MKVFITGGKGFIGYWLVKSFQDKGILPIVYDLSDKDFNIPNITDSVETITGDILNFNQLLQAINNSRADIIVHAASFTNVEKAQFLPEKAIQTNIQGTLNVLKAARKAGIKRVIYTSSRGVFGHIDDHHGHPNYEPINEEYRCKPYTIYGATKYFSECLGTIYARMYNIEFCSLRFSMIFGPRKQETHGRGAFHSILVEESFAGKKVTVPKGGDQKDDLIYVRDAAHAIILATLTPKLSYNIFNIGTGKATTPIDFIRILSYFIPKAQIEIGHGLDYLNRGYQNYCIFDISRAKEQLGYQPQYTLWEGIHDYLCVLKEINKNP